MDDVLGTLVVERVCCELTTIVGAESAHLSPSLLLDSCPELDDGHCSLVL